MIGDILYDKEFAPKIPKQILPKMHYIREYANQGAHGEEVGSKDVVDVIYKLVDVIEWFVMNCDLLDHLNQTRGRIENEHTIELLPRLNEKYPGYLRPEIKSVKFIQNSERCFLEITTAKSIDSLQGDDEEFPVTLINQTSERIDLGFEIKEFDDINKPFDFAFKPDLSITDNVSKFFSDYNDWWLMANIEPELFTEEAKNKIQKRKGENIRKQLLDAGIIKE